MYDALQPVFEQKTCPDQQFVFETLHHAESALQNENKSMLYSDVLQEAYVRLCGALRLDYEDGLLSALPLCGSCTLRTDAAEAFGQSIGDWPAFPDSSAALRRLKESGLKIVVLSNVDNESFARTRTKLEHGFSFDAVYTAEDIGTYKPDLRNFQYAIEAIDDQFSIEQSEILVVANSKYHDILPAHKMGLKVAWINRADAVMGVSSYTADADWTFSTMSEFADAMERAMGMGDVFE